MRCYLGVSGRRGVMYTFVGVIILVVIGSLYFSQSHRSERESFVDVESRVRTMNGFLQDLESDSARAVYISGFRALIAMEQYVSTSGNNLTNASSAFNELFVYGSYNGTNYSIMENATFMDYLRRVQAFADVQGVAVNVTLIKVSLWQSDPWHLQVNYTLDINLTDNRGMAQWRVQRLLVGSVPITDISDPLFTSNTHGRFQHTIVLSNVTQFVGADNDTAGLQEQYRSGFYVARGRGPDILMRFEGNISNSIYGIESFIDVNDLAAQGVVVDMSSSQVDYLYFNHTRATVCNINPVPAYLSPLRLDDVGRRIYLDGGNLNYTTC